MGTITKNFSYSEFEESETARSNKIVNIIATSSVRDAIKNLTVTILQPLRDAWGKPIRITSGYRCPELNALVNGSPTSAHLYGYAADLQSTSQEAFATFAVDFLRKNNIPFDQCIMEKSGRTRWLHIGQYNSARQQRRQVFNINV